MSVAERYLHTNPEQKIFPYQSWSNIHDKGVTGFCGHRLAPETTTTVPPRIPAAKADCFDTFHSDPNNVPMMLSTVFLDFEEFQGFAPIVPLKVKVEFIDGFCEIEHKELGVYGRGETCEEAFVDFLDFLINDYKAYAEEPYENLDSHARVLANHYKEILRRA